MPGRIEDYALIGDCRTAALVSRGGSIDWLCWPRFDSDACFAALLGEEAHGCWRIAPADPEVRIRRRYLPDTLILETTFETATGTVAVIDFMPPRGRASHLVRLVVGRSGKVDMRMRLILRFGYGVTVPWVTRRRDGALRAIAGPNMAILRTPAPLRGEDLTTVSEFTVEAGGSTPFVLSFGLSHARAPLRIDPEQALAAAQDFWTRWARSCRLEGPYAPVMRRSLLTLKALCYAPTGGLVAAPTTSLPEQFGGSRNWDYRYCWIRDATLTLLTLMNAGHFDEAKAWAHWLRRAVAGAPGEMQIMYGIAGERRLLEWSADWLPGYEAAAPVRIGNAAHEQFQLDVYGELMDAFHHARDAGLVGQATWAVQREIIAQIARVWRLPDCGIWEVRGRPRHFTFSKVMAWVAMDRAVKAVEVHGREGPVKAWRQLCDEIRAQVLKNGLNPATGGFQRAYDDPGADASLLLIADVGFLPPDDARIAATVAAVERELLTVEGLVLRYDTRRAEDGLPPGEAAFLPCTLWLANAYARLGRERDARRMFERVLALCNDVGLLSEAYDPQSRRLAGNFPQAFTHVALLTTAMNLSHAVKPSEQRAQHPAAGAGRDGVRQARRRCSAKGRRAGGATPASSPRSASGGRRRPAGS
ncbi:MAG TPA: glycoside hydrolase family 15 protein [Phenylobacterium sp.]|uniref:glycoside hydrolase family 15 protein n=1 Tax=Phenylobacterium sp. TaxID=1871053 RepID=UPI002B496F58|nr:glycoside hydrolase family 15 protein [Phenylobacterium sp.]HKR86802.1 glycoside hydrolase family 15 protein [Phenylobacterium sp.]